MKILSMDGALLRRRILRANILIGLLVFFGAYVINISGEYNSLAEIEAADTLFNYVGIGALLYAAGSMVYCVMTKPFWFPQK